MKRKKAKVNLEIERKFLLKSLPEVHYDKVMIMEQYYCSMSPEPNLRVRKSVDAHTSRVTYTKTMKRRISMGVNEEIESRIDEQTFTRHKITADRYISKTRYVKKFGGLKWEVDAYTHLNLIVAEVELDGMDQAVVLPGFISDKLIMEVTKFKQFSNRSLAHKMQKIYTAE